MKSKQQIIIEIMNKALSETERAKLIWNAAIDMAAKKALVSVDEDAPEDTEDWVELDKSSITDLKFKTDEK